MVEEITNNGFEELIKKSKVALVDFFAEWCMPCLMMAPVIEELAEKMKGIKFAKVNVDENHKLSQEYGVMSIPTLIVFKNGKEVERFSGAMPAEALEEKLKKFL